MAEIWIVAWYDEEINKVRIEVCHSKYGATQRTKWLITNDKSCAARHYKN